MDLSFWELRCAIYFCAPVLWVVSNTDKSYEQMFVALSWMYF